MRKGSGRRALPWVERVLGVMGVACLVWLAVQWEQAASYQQFAKNQTAELLAARDAADKGRPSHARDPVREDPLIGVLDIPRVGVSVAVIEGDDDASLKIAVGHLPDTPLPWDEGNSALAGHRDTFFRPLKDLRVGDEMHLTTSRGEFDYLVRRITIVNPEDVWVLHPEDPEIRLTLITCYPFYFLGSAPRRFVVHAERHLMMGSRPTRGAPPAFGFSRVSSNGSSVPPLR